MINHHPALSVDCATDVGRAMICATRSKATYDSLCSTSEEIRIIRGGSTGDARNAGDRACV
jgi:hypothetical protein